MQIDNVASMRYDPSAFAPIDVYLVIKSQDQIERRKRLIEAKKSGRIGRIEERPTAQGLVVRANLWPPRALSNDRLDLVLPFREPRGLALRRDGSMLIAEIDRIVHLDSCGNPIRSYRLPGFGFLHAIELSADDKRLLVVSSGYDLVMEIDLLTGKPVWEWLAWENGFNPNLDGIYLARDPNRYGEFITQGLAARLVDFTKPKSHGLMTSERSNHPNAACYWPGDERLVLVILGHSGDVIEVDTATGCWRYVIRGLESMPHGIRPYGTGWIVTNTLRGEVWFLDHEFKLDRKVIFADLPGKPGELANHEWLQSAHHLSQDVLFALDANRGLIIVDLLKRTWASVHVDENWCIHTACLVEPEQHSRSVAALQESVSRK